MENKILHCVQNDNLLSIVITSLFCEAISIHKTKADCHVATLLAETGIPTVGWASGLSAILIEDLAVKDLARPVPAKRGVCA